VILVFIVFFPYRLALDPAVIAKGFAQNGQETPAAGQVASLTSTNNFINFCATVNKPLTNGQQIKTGSCNPAPMGVIAATTNMPAAKFVSPTNGQNLQANTAFNIQMAVNNLETGNFVNADTNYYSAPQQVNAQGDIVGHSHFTVQAVPSFTSTKPLDSTVFAFFKGVNSPAVNGVLTESVTSGLPAGSYRLCSINTDANHTPCLVAVAQHGSLDDCVYVSSDNSMSLELRLIHVCSSLSVVAVTILSRPAVELPAMPRELLVLPVMLVMPQEPLVLPVMPQELLVLPVMPHRLPLLQQVQVPPRLEKVRLQGKARVQVQVQGKAQLQGKVQTRRVTAVAKRVVVACVWVTVNPGSGVTTKLRDVTLRLRSPDCCLG
jgi:hypothetical protein